MRYRFFSVTTLVVLSTWKLFDHPQNDENIDDGHTKPLILKPSKDVKKWKSLPNEETPKIQVQLEKDSIPHNVNSKPAVIFLSGSFPLVTVLFLLLIHIYEVSADLVRSSPTVFHRVSSLDGFVDLFFIVIPAVFAVYKWKREKTEVYKKVADPNESQQKQIKLEDVITTLMEVKAELENQRSQLTVRLEDVEKEKEENKRRLRSVEEEITEREKTFDKPEELLREKENLLQSQWKLDQIKKDTEKQILNTEKLLEPLETQMIIQENRK